MARLTFPRERENTTKSVKRQGMRTLAILPHQAAPHAMRYPHTAHMPSTYPGLPRASRPALTLTSERSLTDLGERSASKRVRRRPRCQRYAAPHERGLYD